MKKYNLIVVGGGLTGVAAAVAAARQNLSVLLVEQGGYLGGAMTNGLIYPFMRFWTELDNGETKWLSAGLFTEMRNRCYAYLEGATPAKPAEGPSFAHFNVSNGPGDFNTEYFKYALDDMVEDAGVDVLYHASLFKVNSEGRNLKSILVAVKSGEMELEADFFVDATGDGDLMAFAGCDFQLGREKDSLSQPMTTCFRMANVDDSLLNAQTMREIQDAYKQKKEAGTIKNPREDVLTFRGKAMGKGIVHFNTTRIVKHDPTNPLDVSKAEAMARKQIWEMLCFLKEGGFPAFKDAFIVNSATNIGVREIRKLKGEHVLTAQELIDLTRFEDSIALGDYDIDIHNPEGTGTSHRYFKPGEYYTIPYRSLLPKEFDNLLVGGRCISATHEAQASIRIMPICATTGEAAGTAIGVAYNSGTNTHTVDVKAVQAKLRENGAAID